jgi:predicted Zn-dependent protease
VSSNTVENLDVIASQRAADDPIALAAAAARATHIPAPAPALPAVTRLDQLPGVLGVHVGDSAAAGVTFLRRQCFAGPKALMDWGCGSGSAIDAALEVP